MKWPHYYQLKTVPLYYCLTCNFIFSFAINLHMESSKVAFYRYLSLYHLSKNSSVFHVDDIR